MAYAKPFTATKAKPQAKPVGKLPPAPAKNGPANIIAKAESTGDGKAPEKKGKTKKPKKAAGVAEKRAKLAQLGMQ